MGFSTKYTDRETQLVYYGYRYYDPKVGRFLGRDPLQEKGGRHLYAFLRNRGHNGWDVLGQMPRAHYARGGSYGKDDFFFDGGPGFSLEAERSRLDSYASASVGFENRTRAAAAAKNPNKQGYAQVFELDPATGETVAVGSKAPTSDMDPVDFYNGAAGMLISYNEPVRIEGGGIDIGGEPNKTEKWPEDKCKTLLASLNLLQRQAGAMNEQVNGLANDSVWAEGMSLGHTVLSEGIQLGTSAAGLLKSGWKFVSSRVRPWVAANGKVMSDYHLVSNSGNAFDWIGRTVDWRQGNIVEDIAKAGVVQSADAAADYLSGQSEWGLAREFQDGLNSGQRSVMEVINRRWDAQASLDTVNRKLTNGRSDYEKHCK